MIEGIKGNTLRYKPDLCTGCGLCVAVCPHGVFAAGAGPVRLARPENCIECGACRLNCPAGAVFVESGAGCAWGMIKAALGWKMSAPGCGCGPEDCR